MDVQGGRAVDVYEAVDSRRAVRAFSPRPVPRPVLSRVLEAAARAPSSGMYRRTVNEVVGIDGLVLLCGVALGYADQAVPPLRTARADLSETVTFVGR